MKEKTNLWRDYEKARRIKDRLGVAPAARRNEKFYRGEQWEGEAEDGLPRPVFNLLRRIADFWIGTLSGGAFSLRYTAEDLPFLPEGAEREATVKAMEALTKNASYRWRSLGMDDKIVRALTDACLCGDGVFYSYFSPDGGGARDIVTEVCDGLSLYVADPGVTEVERQEYLILCGRQSVSSLKREAAEAGLGESEIAKITEDGPGSDPYADFYGESDGKATVLLRFWKEDGNVFCEKATESAVIRRGKCGTKRYPVVHFTWLRGRGCFYGTSPLTQLIPAQKYVNRAYALAMKHMEDTAFSKVVYDKSRIPRWSGRPGEAVAVFGGPVDGAVSVVGTGKMEDGYLALLDKAISETKETAGATESALGTEKAQNTSAILALQETAEVPLRAVRSALLRAVAELADVWADMMSSFYPDERLLPVSETEAEAVDFARLRRLLLRAKAEVAEVTRYGAAGTQNVLDKLLSEGHITAAQYVARLPSGMIGEREALLAELEENGEITSVGKEGNDRAKKRK